jgi:ribosomal protein L1
MKTTVEIPEKTLKRAKTVAAAKGLSLEQLVAEAIEDKIGRSEEVGKSEPRWMKFYGAFAKSEEMRSDTRSIQKTIDQEFERIDPGDWK